MRPNILTEILTFSLLILPGSCLKTISLSKALIPTACQTPHHISVTFPHHWNMMQKAILSLRASTKAGLASMAELMAETD